MATVFIVEVVAVYEPPGVAPTGPRLNQINQDMGLADATADRYAPGGASPEDEALERLPDRYGAGWRARRFVSVRTTAEQAGQTVFARLSTRNLEHFIVQVFPDNREEGGGTGEWLYKRSFPAQPDDVLRR